jgi:hypothetical protein
MEDFKPTEPPTEIQNQLDCVVITQKYYVRWRHIPSYASMTPLMYLSIDHTQVESKINASEYDIRIAIGKLFDWINVDEVMIESIQPM